MLTNRFPGMEPDSMKPIRYEARRRDPQRAMIMVFTGVACVLACFTALMMTLAWIGQ